MNIRPKPTDAHTPGKWAFQVDVNGNPVVAPVEPSNGGYAIATFWGPEARANASLCTLMPEMLGLAREYHAWLGVTMTKAHSDGNELLAMKMSNTRHRIASMIGRATGTWP